MLSITELGIFILCVLGGILLVALIVLTFNLLTTVQKLNILIDDLTTKSSKLDGVFNIVDRSADALSLMTDKIAAFVSEKVLGFFHKKEKENIEEEYYE